MMTYVRLAALCWALFNGISMGSSQTCDQQESAGTALLQVSSQTGVFHQHRALNAASHAFTQYKAQFRRMYEAEEHQMREQIFQKRLAQIEAHNGIETRFWHAGVNHLTDRTDTELFAMRGYRRHGKRTSSAKANLKPQSALEKGSSCMSASSKCQNMAAGGSCCPGLVCGAGGSCEKTKEIPAEIDWSAVLGSGKQVVDQGPCGSCWAVAAQGAIELQASLLANKSLSLSAQGMLGCTPNPHECGGTGGCGGATPELGFEWASHNGVVSNAEVPYTAQNTCPEHPKPSVRIQGFVRLEENQGLKVLQSLVSAGPLAVAVDASRWSAYMSGVFDSCSKDVVVDHAVVLVGFGQDPNLNVAYWKIRNSWGPGFGEDGFIRLRRHAPDGDEPCGWDYDPQKGVGCKGGPDKIWVCGECGVLSDVVHPVGTQVVL